MSNHKLFKKGQPGSGVPPVTGLTLRDTDTKTGTNALTHSLTGVAAGALIVVSTTSQDAQVDCAISSTPSLTWTKRADATSFQSPSAEIYTAVYSAGGSISISTNWGAGRVQTSTSYVITGQESSLAGNAAVATGQTTSSVAISTSKTNSMVICATSNWNTTTALTYRLSPVRVLEHIDPSHGTFAHFYYTFPTVAQYTVGYSAPNDVDQGTSTAVLEIRSDTGGGSEPDTSAPSAPVLNSPGRTDTTVSLQWTVAVDPESGIEGYTVYRNNVQVGNTASDLFFNATGLTPNTTYQFRVRAINTAGLFTDSNTINVTTLAATTTTTTTTTTSTGPTTTTTTTSTTTTIVTQPFTFTAQTGDYRRYWGGAEFWGGGSGNMTLVDENGAVFSESHAYRRFTWCDLEGPTQGSYKLSGKFHNFFATHMALKRLVSFGIITNYPCPEGSFHDFEFYDSGGSPYPLYLHQQMQAESTKDWRSGNCNQHWVPNYNSPSYLNRLDQLHLAIANYLNNTTIGGIRLRDAVGYIDIRGVGSWGEWHHGGTANGNDAGHMITDGTFPSNASFQAIIDTHRNRFSQYQLVMMIAALDKNHAGSGFNNTRVPQVISQYLMDNGNAYGDIGIRRDQWGDTAEYYTLLEKDTPTAGVTTRYLTAPINGEPPGYVARDNRGLHMGALETRNINDMGHDEVRKQHPSIIGNSNYGNGGQIDLDTFENGVSQGPMRRAFQQMGCILRLVSGGGTNLTTSSFTIQTRWQNFGMSPQYKKDWRVTFELRNGSGTLVWSGLSTFNPYLFTREDGLLAQQDVFARPAIPAGNYQLSVRILDATGYCEPLQLGIRGRQETSGAYILSNISL